MTLKEQLAADMGLLEAGNLEQEWKDSWLSKKYKRGTLVGDVMWETFKAGYEGGKHPITGVKLAAAYMAGQATKKGK